MTSPAVIEFATVPGSGLAETRLPIRPLDAVLDVISVVSNPARYVTRYDLYRQFARHMETSGVRLTTVECAFGDRPFEVTEAGNPRHIQVRTDHEIWAKENLINLGINRLPRESQYIAWIDADLTFANPRWVQETLQQLQHYDVVQLFAEAHDISPDGVLLNSFRSFAYSYVHNIPRKPGQGYYGGVPTINNPRIAYWHHPGFAFAARRSALNTVGGLFDQAVIGEADFIMVKSIVGEGLDVLYPGVSPGYRKAVIDWQARALKLRGNLGYVPGAILHHWHGRKGSRKYWDRCKILTDTQFDPTTDLSRDCEGLWQLVDDGTPRHIKLRDEIRAYFRQRNEDGCEL
jgi:hypothetical protein